MPCSPLSVPPRRMVARISSSMARSTAGPLGVVVPEEVHVQVAVAGVAVREVAHAGLVADAIDLDEQLDEARARHDDVLGELVLCKLSRRGRELAARLPEPRALRGVLRDEHVDGLAAFGERVAEALERVVELRAGVAVDLDEEHRAARADRRRRPARGSPSSVGPSISSRQRGTSPAATTRRTASAAARTSSKSASSVAISVGFGTSLQRDLGEDAERALAADEERGDVVAGDALDGALAGAEDATAHEARLEAEHVLARHAVLERARTAGVLGDVAADHARLQRVGIGRIEEALGLDRARAGRP